MRKYLTTLLLIGMGFCQKKSISDGQYTFYKKDELIEKRMLNSNVITTTLDKGSYDKICYPDLSTFDKLYMRKIDEYALNFDGSNDYFGVSGK